MIRLERYIVCKPKIDLTVGHFVSFYPIRSTENTMAMFIRNIIVKVYLNIIDMQGAVSLSPSDGNFKWIEPSASILSQFILWIFIVLLFQFA